jgi:hypothetical protein
MTKCIIVGVIVNTLVAWTIAQDQAQRRRPGRALTSRTPLILAKAKELLGKLGWEAPDQGKGGAACHAEAVVVGGHKAIQVPNVDPALLLQLAETGF